MSYIQSPCSNNCCLDPDDICLGCFRSVEEIMQWASTDTSSQQKQQILINAKQRKEARTLINE